MLKHSHSLLLVLVLLVLSGCYSRLHHQDLGGLMPAENIERHHPEKLKIAYHVYTLSSHGAWSQPTKALTESLSRYKISDSIDTEKYEAERINIVVYELDRKRPTSVLGGLWSLVSLGTIFIVPSHDEAEYPVEIHVIDPRNDEANRFRRIQTTYTIGTWMWLPFLARSSKEHDQGNLNFAELRHVALRNIFDKLISDLVQESPIAINTLNSMK